METDSEPIIGSLYRHQSNPDRYLFVADPKPFPKNWANMRPWKLVVKGFELADPELIQQLGTQWFCEFKLPKS